MNQNEKKNLKSGPHSLTIYEDCIIVETRINRKNSLASRYTLDEYEKALACYNRCIEPVSFVEIKAN